MLMTLTPVLTLVGSGAELFSWLDLGRVFCDIAPNAFLHEQSRLEEFCRKRRLANHPVVEEVYVLLF